MDERGAWPISDAIAGCLNPDDERPRVVYRLSGDQFLLVEYGEMILDINVRVRIHLLEEALKRLQPDGFLETIPGVRSLLIKYDPLCLALADLLSLLKALDGDLPPVEETEIQSRIVHLPIAIRDRWTRDAIARYCESVRPTAPYLPDNVDFVARCNALTSPDMVAHNLTSTTHLVLGLGDVYLGAPCAVPLDPRFRLIVPKYNPARMFTPEGAVGIGGAFICIYPMESPGGYQLVGRTISIWNTEQNGPVFREAPWLLRFFDRIQFDQVSEDELETIRTEMHNGGYEVRIEPGTFSVREYNEFLRTVNEEAISVKERQEEAARSAMVGY